MVAAGYKMSHSGGLLITVRDADKAEAVDIARRYARLGFKLYATDGTAAVLSRHGVESEVVDRHAMLPLLETGRIQYVISTSDHGRDPKDTFVQLRRKAVERGIPHFTSLDTAGALADGIRSRYTLENVELVDLNAMRTKKRRLHFVKMRGAGNDYLYFDCFEQVVDSPEFLAVRLSKRKSGIGSDGIVLIGPSEKADASMRMFNADGTESMAAGNPLRCVAKYLYESGRVRSADMTIETAGGIRRAHCFVRDESVFSVMVDMGCPAFAPEQVPVRLEGDRILQRSVSLAGEARTVSCVSMGNPHCVIFTDDVARVPLDRVGPAIEHDPLFPARVNVSFAEPVSRNTLRMRVWERGIGETMACGTAACAAAVLAVENGLCARDADILIHLPGGDLMVRYDRSGLVWLIGDAVTDFEGTVEI